MALRAWHGTSSLTRLLLECGADPNDEETPYHVPESYDNTIARILVESGKLNAVSLACMLVRKADWHDEDGMRLLLSGGADPNIQPRFGVNAMQQSLRRDNSLSAIELLLNHGGDPALGSNRDRRSALEIAARRGRADALDLFQQRGVGFNLAPFDSLVAACARADEGEIHAIIQAHPDLSSQIMSEAASLLSEFAGNGNVNGFGAFLIWGLPLTLCTRGDAYFDIAPASTRTACGCLASST